jgi:hypothetical protein
MNSPLDSWISCMLLLFTDFYSCVWSMCTALGHCKQKVVATINGVFFLILFLSSYITPEAVVPRFWNFAWNLTRQNVLELRYSSWMFRLWPCCGFVGKLSPKCPLVRVTTKPGRLVSFWHSKSWNSLLLDCKQCSSLTRRGNCVGTWAPSAQ